MEGAFPNALLLGTESERKEVLPYTLSRDETHACRTARETAAPEHRLLF